MYSKAFVSGGTAEYPGFNQMHEDSGRHIFYLSISGIYARQGICASPDFKIYVSVTIRGTTNHIVML